MSFGLSVFNSNRETLFSTDGDYVRVVDVFNPFTVSVPGSKTYPGFVDIQVVVKQGNSRILTVLLNDNTVSWSYSDSFSWPEYGSDALITVLTT